MLKIFYENSQEMENDQPLCDTQIMGIIQEIAPPSPPRKFYQRHTKITSKRTTIWTLNFDFVPGRDFIVWAFSLGIFEEKNYDFRRRKCSFCKRYLLKVPTHINVYIPIILQGSNVIRCIVCTETLLRLLRTDTAVRLQRVLVIAVGGK